MKKLIAAITLSLSMFGAPQFASAQEGGADELMSLMKMEQLLEQSIEQMLQLQIQQNPGIAPFRDIMLSYLQRQMSYDRLKPDMISLYENAFTPDELQGLIDFYRTPVGQKSIEVMPGLMAEGAQLGAARVQENIGELQAEIEAEAKRLQEAEGKTE